MSLKNYDRNQKKDKEYIKQSGLLLAGVDVSKAKHDACIGTLEVSGAGSGSGWVIAIIEFTTFIKKHPAGYGKPILPWKTIFLSSERLSWVYCLGAKRVGI